MWYVNEYQLSLDIIDDVLGFILTMWYVNNVLFTLPLTVFIGFILTMWYVNDELDYERAREYNMVLY